VAAGDAALADAGEVASQNAQTDVPPEPHRGPIGAVASSVREQFTSDSPSHRTTEHT
jgi:hypothetical protein